MAKKKPNPFSTEALAQVQDFAPVVKAKAALEVAVRSTGQERVGDDAPRTPRGLHLAGVGRRFRHGQVELCGAASVGAGVTRRPACG